MMPDMDGLETARRIRENPAATATRLMLLSSAGRPEEMAAGNELNILRCLTKPVKQSDLLDAITRALGVATGDEAGTESIELEPDSRSPSLNILLAEDGAVNRKVAVRMLQKLGHTTVVANNGREAVNALKTHACDLVLMDVQMPEMDGFEATAAIRANEAASGRRTPIVAMTANAMKGDRETCLDAGMDDYLSKPIRSAELRAVIDRVALKARLGTIVRWTTDRQPNSEQGPTQRSEKTND